MPKTGQSRHNIKIRTMKRKSIFLSIVLLLFAGTQLFAVGVGVAVNNKATGPGDGCRYTIYETSPAGETIILAQGFGPCPKWSKVAGKFVCDFSPESEIGAVLVKSGYKKNELKNFVIQDYDSRKQTNNKPGIVTSPKTK
ncbi:MAG: hypothetical protein CVU13_07350 [Bacteroidetes bacterium HGW-Bacteroidetes-8]|jgi:hypothetical protein|nr:MAG: hypothetical protein CVU13_07350 [Bacteroidetes bacterium HGW-Bacteroidetes-8]